MRKHVFSSFDRRFSFLFFYWSTKICHQCSKHMGKRLLCWCCTIVAPIIRARRTKKFKIIVIVRPNSHDRVLVHWLKTDEDERWSIVYLYVDIFFLSVSVDEESANDILSQQWSILDENASQMLSDWLSLSSSFTRLIHCKLTFYSRFISSRREKKRKRAKASLIDCRGKKNPMHIIRAVALSDIWTSFSLLTRWWNVCWTRTRTQSNTSCCWSLNRWWNVSGSFYWWSKCHARWAKWSDRNTFHWSKCLKIWWKICWTNTRWTRMNQRFIDGRNQTGRKNICISCCRFRNRTEIMKIRMRRTRRIDFQWFSIIRR